MLNLKYVMDIQNGILLQHNMDNVTDLREWLQTTDYKGGVGMIIKSSIKKECVSEFKDLIKEHVQHNSEDKGVLQMKYHVDFTDDTVFWWVNQKYRL